VVLFSYFLNIQVTVLKESKSLSLDEGYFSIPEEEVKWKTTDNDMSYGYYYPPQNKDFKVRQISLWCFVICLKTWIK